MKFYTKCSEELLERLERETNVLWCGGYKPTQLTTDIDYISLDDNELIYHYPPEYGYFELTNNSFVDYVEFIVEEKEES